MKSTFSRLFTMTAALILLCLTVLGFSFRGLMYSYLVDEKEESLQTNATAVADLAAAYTTTGELQDNWDFRMSLSLVAGVAETRIYVCDTDGNVAVCSCSSFSCEHLGQNVGTGYVKQAIENKQYSRTGTIGNLVTEKSFIMSVPIISTVTGSPIGSVLVAATAGQISEFLMRVSNYFLWTAIIVLAISLVVVSLLARSQSKPLKAMADTVQRFGHGELQARVALGGNNTEEIDELAAAFNAMAQSLEQAEGQRREFVANVSHELKTPMTTIAGFLDGMLDGTIPPERHRQYMQTVSDEVRRLSRLVRTMLDISRLQAQGVPEAKKSRFNISESLGRVLLSFEQKINEKHLDVQVGMPEEDVMVFADSDSITQVIYNLLDNAIKFCSQEGQLGLHLEKRADKAVVRISNTGPVIPEKELPLVFDRFHKMDKSRSEDRDGYGLGLYIVKTIITGHGEDVFVSSRDGVTEFGFTLALAPHTKQKAQEPKK